MKGLFTRLIQSRTVENLREMKPYWKANEVVQADRKEKNLADLIDEPYLTDVEKRRRAKS